MPEPTDHRAQAEEWLGDAARSWRSGHSSDREAVAAALIGIGHALLALAAQSHRRLPCCPHCEAQTGSHISAIDCLVGGHVMGTAQPVTRPQDDEQPESGQDHASRAHTSTRSGVSPLRLCVLCSRTDDDLIHREEWRDGYHPFEDRRR